MNKGRAAFVALMVALTGGLLLWTYLRRFEEEFSGGPKVALLVLTRTLEPGSIIKEDDLGERGIPQAYVESRAIRVADKAKVLNIRTTVPLKAQQSLQWTDLVTPADENQEISALIHPGMRAAIVRAEGSAAALVAAGDRVDVIGSFTKPGSGDQARAAVVLLQNVIVLGRKGEGRAGNGNELALSVTLQQAEILTVASEKGKLSVVLRSKTDIRIQEGLAEVNSADLIEAEKKPVAAARAAPAKVGPAPVK